MAFEKLTHNKSGRKSINLKPLVGSIVFEEECGAKLVTSLECESATATASNSLSSPEHYSLSFSFLVSLFLVFSMLLFFRVDSNVF
jgi:hypothetical protein